MGDRLVPIDDVALPNKMVAVGVSRDNNSKFAARWAINNLLTHKTKSSLFLIHVRRKQHHEQGDLTDADMSQLFKPFRAYCARKEVLAKEIVIDHDDISEALLNFVDDNIITHFVLGASTRSTLQMQWRVPDIPTMINESAPGFCSVYVISKTEIQSVRLAAVPAAILSSISSTPNCQKMLSHFLTKQSEPEEEVRSERRRWNRKLSVDSIDTLFRGEKNISNNNRLGVHEDSNDHLNFVSHVVTDQNEDVTTLQESTERLHRLQSKNVEAKLRRMKLELKQSIDIYNRTWKGAYTAIKKVKEIHHCKLEESPKFEIAGLLEDAVVNLYEEKEMYMHRAAFEAAKKAEKVAKLEAERRRHAELKAKRNAEAKYRALEVLSHNNVRYRKYTIEDIEAATDHFSDSFKIGEGGYGPVYIGKLDHTKVAIKVLGLGAAQGNKQFQREVEILSRMRHPNMVLLLGACPQYGCLVYEYMSYGSLEDRLFRKGNTPPISWRIRFRIAADIATGLLFLHNAKPEPLVHCDVKPANILLDSNYTCKIGDVGLSRLLPASIADNVTQYRMTSAAGTFCYIDPEFQQTGKLVVKSDLYSFGVMLLQILTARPPMGLIRRVEKSIAEGTFADLLDPSVPDWPVKEALSFAKIALRCVEIKQKDRPDLSSVVLPELNRLKEFGSNNMSELNSTDSSS
ncbi:hypothetical protein DCAR_0208733 [Daucus carota subsp. sativus]|uniref:RING-type E3 ubiquitin transferase n=1 Tax=Daucus carota subsp. sativus TaxID=79200 RepID=A0AAF0WGI0_DAUCS|nr:hypothetical protein DCAR_0208733 [Daucus carota subsp. sativus]